MDTGNQYDLVEHKRKAVRRNENADDGAVTITINFATGEVQESRNETKVTLHDKVIIHEGQGIDVFFETDGWVFAEFTASVGRARAWLPASQVESN